MTSTEIYKDFLVILQKNSVGAVTIPEFERMWDMAQRQHLRDSLPISGTLRGMNKTSAFLTPRVVQLNGDGIGVYNPGGNKTGDLFSGPVCWVSKWENPCCDSPPIGQAGFTVCPVLPVEEHLSITDDINNAPSDSRPKAFLIDDRRIQVLPRAVGYLMTWYWRKPTPIVVGRDPLYPYPNERPLEGAPGQVDPEWSQADIDDITMRCLQLAGVKLQSDRLVQIGAALQGRGER